MKSFLGGLVKIVILREGKNRVRDRIDTDKNNGVLGTGTTNPSENDTDLQTSVAASSTALTSSTADKQLVLDYNLNSGTANANTFTEYKTMLNSGNTDFTRITFSGIAKTNTKEIQISTVINIP